MNISFLRLFFFGAISLTLTFTLGYVSLRAISRFTVKECMALAGAWGMALQSAIAFVNFLCGFSGRTFFLLATAGLFIISLWLLTRQLWQAEERENYRWLYLAILFWLVLLGMQFFVVLYSGGFYYGDWWMHFDIAQIFLGLQKTDTVYFGTYNVTSRTPLFNLFSSYYLALLENSFAVYQITAILPGVFLTLLIPLFLRPSLIPLAFFLVAFSPYLSNMITYPWPKVLATVYILTGIYFYLDLRNNPRTRVYSLSGIGCGVSWGLAFLSHPSAILYVIAPIIDNLWVNRKNLALVVRQLFFPLILMIAVCLPWYLWGISHFGLASIFQTAMGTTGGATASVRISDAFNNAWSTVYPLELSDAVQDRIQKGPGEGSELYILRYRLWNSWFRLYFSVLAGSITITLSAVLLTVFGKRVFGKVKGKPLFPRSFLVSVLASGFLGGCFLQPGFHRGGIIGESMTPIVVLLLLIVTEYLAMLPVRLKQLILFTIVGEFVLSRGIHLLFLGAEKTVVWDGNADLKTNYSLQFARDLIGTPIGLFMAIVALIIFLVIGWKTVSGGGDLRESLE